MVASIMHFLVRIGKIQIVPIADSYLLRNTFKKPPRMSREVVQTNYASLSPFAESDITALSDENDLLVWFSPSKSDTIRIPEAYLLFSALMARDKSDRISIFNTDPSLLIVIKNNRLIAQSTLKSDDTIFLDRLKREHSLETVERYNSDEYAALLDAGYASLTFNHYKQFFSLDIPDFSSFKSTLEAVATPLSILILSALGYHYAVNYHLTQKLEESRQIYQEGRGAMIPIKHRQETIAQHKQAWNSFIDETLVRPDALSAAYPLLHVAHETNTTVKYVKVSGGKIETVVETPISTTFLKAIIATRQFENVKLEFSKTDPIRHIDNAKMTARIIPFDIN
ncbi:hypothetical protein, partial [uncultured Sulfuricurvum sp.]|uniref:hypothetical protein n=1 Tax=uncultured Sulfuricurvum sp. TaxID=430693 RepID=UPI002606F994